MGDTSIEWTDKTWNPTRGCSRVDDDGCRNCYAMRQAHRQNFENGLVRGAYHGLTTIRKGKVDWAGQARLVPDQLALPLHWRKPQRIFVDSMSDVFHESLSNEAIAAVFGAMACCSQHTFQVLTKRPERALEWFKWIEIEGLEVCQREFWQHTNRVGMRPWEWPLKNVWLGVSVSTQKNAAERIPLLLQCPAAIRFVSYEPALEPVDFTKLDAEAAGHKDFYQINALTGRQTDMGRPCSDVGAKLDWIIVGGESGNGARPFDLAWARSTIQQCRAAGVACFVKQLGRHPRWTQFGQTTLAQTNEDMAVLIDIAKDRKGGDWSKWPEELRVRQFPTSRAA